MNKYTLSNGLKIEKDQIDRNIRKAKEQKLNEHFDQYGYYFCTTCKKNDCLPITIAHIVSVNDCQRNGNTELSWDTNNMVVEGIPCHAKRDKNCLNYKK